MLGRLESQKEVENMRIHDSVFFRSRVENPERRAVLVERVLQRLEAASSYGEFNRWMRFFERGLRRAAPVVGDSTPPDEHLAAFSESLVRRSVAASILSPGMIWELWVRERNHRAPATSTLRGWLHEAENNTVNDYDREWMIETIDERGDRRDCDCCGDRFFVDDLAETYDSGLVCESCRENSYTWSSYYDSYVNRDYTARAIDANGRHCLIHSDDESFSFDDELDVYVHQDYEAPQRSVIRDYHSSKHHQRPIEDAWAIAHNRYFGVELEVECVGSRSRNECAGAIHEAVNGGVYGHRMFFERDGSLSEGFEMISQPMSLPALRELFGFLRSSELIAGMRSHRTSTCGLHVHVSRTGLSNLTIARAVTFVNDPGNDAFITAIARRYNTGFCNIQEKQIETAHLPGDRYEAVNLTGSRTIEFRVFRGSLKFEAVIAAIEFCHALLQFCARESTGASSLNARSFLAFCARSMPDETATMREYVAQRTGGVFNHAEAA